MAPHECDAHLAPKKILEKTGIPLLPAVHKLAPCHEILGGGSLLGAMLPRIEVMRRANSTWRAIRRWIASS